MSTEIKDVRAPQISEKSIVEALAEDVALHGWKVSSYRVAQDVEREERTLTINLHKSTGPEQGVLAYPDDKEKRARRKTAAAEADGEAGTD